MVAAPEVDVHGNSCSNNNMIVKIENESRSDWRAEQVIVGNAEALEALREIITFPLLYQREGQTLGIRWQRGLLLYGPPGTGKTRLVRAVVQETGAHLTVLSPQSVHRAYAGESERILREAFSAASAHAMSGNPSVVFIDEIDAICPRRDSRREQNVRISSQLSALMEANNDSSASSAHVVVVASTNKVDAIDPSLRRPGHFDVEVEVTTPTEEERFQILMFYTRKVFLDPDVDLKAIAASCNGYVGADLEDLCREATRSGHRTSDVPHLTMEDWKHATSVVGPSMTKGVTVEVAKVTWDDIGGLKDVKKKVQQAVEWPIKYSAAFSSLGIQPYRGVLLHGPPGCSKTTIAKAAANAAQASFFALSGADMYSMYVGEGEALLRRTFHRARLAAPSIIFVDEVDVVATERGGSSSNNVAVGERLLSTLLTEMDGLEQSKGVLVLAATNRPHAIDAALMRPGRFDQVIYVPPPDLEARYEILCVHTRNMKIGDDVDLRRIAEDTELFTGAELENLCKEAGIVALRESISATAILNKHFQTVKESLKPALTRSDVEQYSSLMKAQQLFESGVYEDRKRKKNYLDPVSPVEVGKLSFVVLGAACLLYPACKIIKEMLCCQQSNVGHAAAT